MGGDASRWRWRNPFAQAWRALWRLRCAPLRHFHRCHFIACGRRRRCGRVDEFINATRTVLLGGTECAAARRRSTGARVARFSRIKVSRKSNCLPLGWDVLLVCLPRRHAGTPPARPS